VYLAVIEEITERADVAKGSFYQYFHNRDDLLHVLLTRRLEELRVLVAATPPPNTFAKRVQLLLHYHLEYFLRHEDFLFFLHQIRGLVKMRGEETPIVQETYRRYLRFLAEWLQPDNRKRLVNGQTREEGACALLGLLTGFLSHYAILFPLTMLGDEKGRVENALLHACLAFWE